MVGRHAFDGGTDEGDLAPEDLLGDDHEAFDRVCAGATAGPLAVTGDPFAGREAVLDAATERLDATRVRLAPDSDRGDPLADADDGPLVVEGCHHLYRRTVGGFDTLERVLDRLARHEGAVVTGWNRYAWAYLAATRGLDREFPVRVELAALATERLAAHVLSRYEDLPTFRPDEPDRGGLVTVRRYALGPVSVPVPVPNVAALAAPDGDGDGDIDPEDVVFERLAAVSGGNVGVATALWEGLGDGTRPSDVAAPGTDLDLDREEAFCLRVVLASEVIEREELAAVVDGLDRVLRRLARAELVAVSDGRVALRPAAVPTAVAGVERGRFT